MPVDIELSLRITVNNDEEADKIIQAAFSGLAGELVRIGVLYGHVPVAGVVANAMTPPLAESQPIQNKVKPESTIELKPVELKVGNRVAESKEEKKDKPTVGIAGRTRLGRS